MKVHDGVLNVVNFQLPLIPHRPPGPAGFIIGKLEPGQNRKVQLECRRVETSCNMGWRGEEVSGGGCGGSEEQNEVNNVPISSKQSRMWLTCLVDLTE